MNGFPSWTVTRQQTVEAHVPAESVEVTAGRVSEGRSPGEPLAGPSASPDGSPTAFRGQAQGLGGEEVWDQNSRVLVTRGSEVQRLG